MNTDDIPKLIDYRGIKIKEGDTIQHPTGDKAKVVYDSSFEDPWRAVYEDGESLWLGNQVNEKGQAVVV